MLICQLYNRDHPNSELRTSTLVYSAILAALRSLIHSPMMDCSTPTKRITQRRMGCIQSNDALVHTFRKRSLVSTRQWTTSLLALLHVLQEEITNHIQPQYIKILRGLAPTLYNVQSKIGPREKEMKDHCGSFTDHMLSLLSRPLPKFTFVRKWETTKFL